MMNAQSFCKNFLRNMCLTFNQFLSSVHILRIHRPSRLRHGTRLGFSSRD
jgi:hypothetical protein